MTQKEIEKFLANTKGYVNGKSMAATSGSLCALFGLSSHINLV